MLANILSICILFSVMAALYQTNISFHTTQIKLKTCPSKVKFNFNGGQTSTTTIHCCTTLYWQTEWNVFLAPGPGTTLSRGRSG